MTLFDRKCILTVGEAGARGVQFDERLHVTFRVVKSLGAEINRAEFEVYGLSPESRNRCLQKDLVVQFEAGYVSNYELLTIADITRAVVSYEPPDIITKIEAGDGARALRDRKVNLSFSAGASVQRVFDAVAGELGLGERATGVPVQGEYQEGVSFSTTAREALNKVARRAGVVWSIQDGDLYIAKRDLPVDGRGVLLSPGTGLIGSPEPLEDPEPDLETKGGAGYRVRSLLQPKIRPGERVIIEARDVSGVFRVDVVEHVGDTRGNEWHTEAEVYAE